MPAHLVLRLDAPLMAFGGPTIDAHGVVRDFPAASMLTGLLANALGWRRTERSRHARLQQRLIFGARIEFRERRIRDFQTAALRADEVGWTTSGQPERRAGGGATYHAPHLRFRDYDAGALVCVVARLAPESEPPILDDIAHALDWPARPLFIGRKPCVPADRVLQGKVEAETVHEALAAAPRLAPSSKTGALSACWPEGEGPAEGEQLERMTIADGRDWIAGVHAGSRTLIRGLVSPPLAPEAA